MTSNWVDRTPPTVWPSERRLATLLFRGKRKYRDDVTFDEDVDSSQLVRLQGGQLHRDTILRMFVMRDPDIPKNPFTNLPLRDTELVQIFGRESRFRPGARTISSFYGSEHVDAYDAWKQTAEGRDMVRAIQNDVAEANVPEANIPEANDNARPRMLFGLWTMKDPLRENMRETHMEFRTEALESDLSENVREWLIQCVVSNHEDLRFFNDVAPDAELRVDVSQCRLTFRYSSVPNTVTQQHVWDWVRRVAEVMGTECRYFSESDWSVAVTTIADNMHVALAHIVPSQIDPDDVDDDVQEVETLVVHGQPVTPWFL